MSPLEGFDSVLQTFESFEGFKMLFLEEFEIVTQTNFKRIVVELNVKLPDENEKVSVNNVKVGGLFAMLDTEPLDDGQEVIGEDVMHIHLVPKVELK